MGMNQATPLAVACQEFVASLTLQKQTTPKLRTHTRARIQARTHAPSCAGDMNGGVKREQAAVTCWHRRMSSAVSSEQKNTLTHMFPLV